MKKFRLSSKTKEIKLGQLWYDPIADILFEVTDLHEIGSITCTITNEAPLEGPYYTECQTNGWIYKETLFESFKYIGEM